MEDKLSLGEWLEQILPFLANGVVTRATTEVLGGEATIYRMNGIIRIDFKPTVL
jgi:hypothetical protein